MHLDWCCFDLFSKRWAITIGCSKFILKYSCFPNPFLVSSHDSISVSLFSVLFKLSSLFAAVFHALYFFGFFSSSHRIYLIPQRRTMSRPCFLGYTIPLPIFLVLYYTIFSVRKNNSLHPPLPWYSVLPLPQYNKPRYTTIWYL